MIILNLTVVLLFFAVLVNPRNVGESWSDQVVSNFCVHQVSQVPKVFEIGDRHLLLETGADISQRLRERKQPQTFWLYNWRSGRVDPKLVSLGDIFANISSNDDELVFASSLNLCTLFLDPLDQPRRRRSISNNLVRIDNAGYEQNYYQNRRRTVDLEEIRGLLRSNLKQTVESDHEQIKNQMRMFDIQLQLLNERLSKWAQGGLSSDLHDLRGSQDFRNTDNSYSSSKNGDFAKCPKLIVATFCTGQWSQESDICGDSGRPCWYRSQFYQYLTTDQTLKLISVPYNHRTLVNLLPYRGLFHFDSGFVLLDSKLRCVSQEGGDKAANPKNVFAFRQRLFSGFNVNGRTMVQTRPGMVESLASQQGITIAEMINCYDNSSLIQSTPWIAEDFKLREPEPKPSKPKSRPRKRPKSSRHKFSNEEPDDRDDFSKEEFKKDTKKNEENRPAAAILIPEQLEKVEPIFEEAERLQTEQTPKEEEVEEPKLKQIKPQTIRYKWYWFVIGVAFVLFLCCCLRKDDNTDERDLARKQRARQRKRLFLRDRSKRSRRRSKSRSAKKGDTTRAGREALSEKEVSVSGVEQVEVMGDQRDDWRPFAGYLNSIVSAYHHLTGKVTHNSHSNLIEVDPAYLDQVEPVEIRGQLKSLIDDSQVISQVLPLVSSTIHQLELSEQDTSTSN